MHFIHEQYSYQKLVRTLLFFSLLICTTTFAQKNAGIEFIGTIKDDSLKPVTNCYVKITRKGSSMILAYLNTGNSNRFTSNVPFVSDTFLVSVSHVGYITATNKYLLQEPGSISADIMLMQKRDTLKEVLLKAPPVWVRGDTTFFSAEAFKDGDERKLKDIITKMPGFEIDDDGNLLFKKQRVEKVMIEGEEIFADKVRLMLNNFPVHVLSTIQAIENQSNNKLLKGLTNEKKIFLNIGLNNAKLKTAFGDGEAGIGTNSRYFLNTVLFSMYGKLKLGYIGNWNSIGQGIEWKEQEELKNDPIRMSEQWMMNSQYLQIINNFEGNRYITNRQFNHSLQLNIPVSKTVKNNLEVNFISDRQLQKTFYQSSFYNGTEFIRRNDTNDIIHRPSILAIKQNFEWSIDSKRVLKANAYFHRNTSNSSHYAIYNQEGRVNSTQNFIQNNWNSYSVTAELTHRVSPTKATKWYGFAFKNAYPQSALGISEAWQLLFQLPDSNYTHLRQQLKNTFTIGRAGWELTKKTKKRLVINNISFNWLSSNIGNNMVFKNPADETKNHQPSMFSNAGKYDIKTFTNNTQTGFTAFKLPFLLKMDYGIAVTSINEKLDNHKFFTPVYSFEVSQKKRLAKTLHGSFTGSYKQKQAEPYDLHGILLPTSLSSFSRNVNIDEPLRSLNLGYGVSYFYPRKLSNTNLIVSYNRYFSGFTAITSLNQFVALNSDSLITRPTGFFSTSSTSTVPSRLLDAVFTLGGGISSAQRYIERSGSLLSSQYLFYSAFITVQKKWNKKYFLYGRVNYSGSETRLPRELEGSIDSKVSHLKFQVSQRVVLNKIFSLSANTDLFNQNLFSRANASFIFADIQCNVTLPKKPLSFTIAVSNLTNQRYFNSVNNHALYQSFYSVPLVERNLFVSARYEL